MHWLFALFGIVRNSSHRIALHCIALTGAVALGDALGAQVQVRRDIETISTNPPKSSVKASVGVAWHKNTEFRKKITKNVHDHMAKEIREVMNISVRQVKALVKDKKLHGPNGSNLAP